MKAEITKRTKIKCLDGNTKTVGKTKHFKLKKATTGMSIDEMCRRCSIKPDSKTCNDLLIDYCTGGYFIKDKDYY